MSNPLRPMMKNLTVLPSAISRRAFLARHPRDGAVEGAGEAALASCNEEEMRLLLPVPAISAGAPAACRGCRDVGKHIRHALGIKAAPPTAALLRAPKLPPRPPSAWPW
jgi:hypothetical protein